MRKKYFKIMAILCAMGLSIVNIPPNHVFAAGTFEEFEPDDSETEDEYEEDDEFQDSEDDYEQDSKDDYEHDSKDDSEEESEEYEGDDEAASDIEEDGSSLELAVSKISMTQNMKKEIGYSLYIADTTEVEDESEWEIEEEVIIPNVKSSDTKVATVSVDEDNIYITTKKNAKYGSKATITVYYGELSQKINVIVVKNTATKLSSKKKTIKVKKGKTFTWNIKVSALNSKQALSDKAKAKSSKPKVAKITKVTTKAGKIVVKGKAKKTGKTTWKVKAGKKTIKVTIKVK